jgi:lipid-A-disaccharide synthase
VDRTGLAQRRPIVCLFAGEESGDRLGAALMRAIRAQAGSSIDLQGVGGREMAAEGLHSLVQSQEFAAIGFGILARVPALWRHMQDVTRAVVAAQPAVLVIIDSPEFSHQVARRVRKRAPSISIVNYVSPSVWAWRPGRARKMRAYVDHVLALLPFEPEVHARLGGPPCSYVGHPAIERLTELRPDAQETARRMSDPPLLLVLPGSRSGEIRRMLGVFGDAIELLHGRGERFELVLPTLPQLAGTVTTQTRAWRVQPRIVVDPAEHRLGFRSARAALAKSGTVTLELALAGVPMVTAYKVSLFDEAIARLAIDVPSVILANLVLGDNVVPEFLQRDCTPPALADALAPLLHDTPQRRRQVEAFARFDTIMEVGKASPSHRAAEVVLRYATRSAAR